jgi:hypothetical protein
MNTHRRVHLGHARAQHVRVAILDDPQCALERLEAARVLLHRELHVAGANDAGALGVAELKPDLGHDLALVADLGVVDEGTRLGVGRQLAGGGILETLDDGRLAGAVGADDEGQRLVEGDGLGLLVVEGADAQDVERFDGRHGGGWLAELNLRQLLCVTWYEWETGHAWESRRLVRLRVL